MPVSDRDLYAYLRNMERLPDASYAEEHVFWDPADETLQGQQGMLSALLGGEDLHVPANHNDMVACPRKDAKLYASWASQIFLGKVLEASFVKPHLFVARTVNFDVCAVAVLGIERVAYSAWADGKYWWGPRMKAARLWFRDGISQLRPWIDRLILGLNQIELNLNKPSGESHAAFPTGPEWSVPLPKKEIARRLGLSLYLLNNSNFRMRAENRSRWKIDLASLPTHMRGPFLPLSSGEM